MADTFKSTTVIVLIFLFIVFTVGAAKAQGNTCSSVGLRPADIQAAVEKKQGFPPTDQAAAIHEVLTEIFQELKAKKDPCKDVVQFKIYVTEGNVLIKQEKLQEAAKFYKQAIASAQNFDNTIDKGIQTKFLLSAIMTLGDIYYKLGEFKEAQSYYESLVSSIKSPAFPTIMAQYGFPQAGGMKSRAMLRLASVYENTKQNDKARKIYKELLVPPYCLLDPISNPETCSEIEQKSKKKDE